MLDATGSEASNDEDSASDGSPHLALWLSTVEATWWCLLGFQVEHDFQDHVERCAEQILQIDEAADCAGSMDLRVACIKCDKRVTVSVADNLYLYSLHSMIEVSAKA